jgi:uncharacterized RDD family membrane protein YckC
MALLGASVGVFYLSTGQLPDWMGSGVARAEIVGFCVLVLPVGLYLYCSESSPRHATVGKRALELVVVSDDERGDVTRFRIAVRTVVKLFPWELAHFFVWHTVAMASRAQPAFPEWLQAGLVSSLAIPVGYVLVIALRRDGRGPHDLVAGTRVTYAHGATAGRRERAVPMIPG